MLKNNTMSGDQALILTQAQQYRGVEIAEALPMGLQRLDLARHTVIAPDGRRFVVATYDDTRLGRGYVTAAYPQQNGYLTLVRLALCEIGSITPEEAVQRHIAVAQAIQQGKLNEFLRSVR